MKKEETIKFYGQIEADDLRKVVVKVGFTWKELWQIQASINKAIEDLHEYTTIRHLCHLLDKISELELQSRELHSQAKAMPQE